MENNLYNNINKIQKEMEKPIYSEQECRNMVFDYTLFVINCMEGKEISLYVGAWFNKHKKNPDDKEPDTP